MAVSDPASALGEAVGKLIESRLKKTVEETVKPLGYALGPRKLKNGLGNQHQIDIVVVNSQAKPIILLEPKYLRYTKHNWDKGSRLCIAHYALRKTTNTIRKSIGILAGNWTDASKDFIRSFGVEIHIISFDRMVSVLGKYGIAFDWDEKDRKTPRSAWGKFKKLKASQLEELAEALTYDVEPALLKSVSTTLDLDPNAPREVEGVEILLTMKQGESLLASFKNITEAMSYMLKFQVDKKDLREMIG